MSSRRVATKAIMAIGLFGVLIGAVGVLVPSRPAIAAVNRTINFQGKVVNSNGTNVADGSYSFVFKMYTVSSAGSALWTETKSLTVTDGVFQTNLGDVTTMIGLVDFNTSTNYLGINFNSDGEMSPRILFTAAPYALNSDLLDGLDSSALAQLNPGSAQSGSLNVTGSVQAGTSLQSPLVDNTGTLGLGTGAATTGVTVGRATSTTNLTLQGSAGTSWSATSASGSTTVSFVSPTTTNAIRFQNAGGDVCTTVAATCNATYQAAGTYLAKNAADTSSFAVTAANYLYGFTNSNGTPATGGVLKLDNGANTGSTLLVTASGNPAASNALIVANNTNGSASGNLLDLQVSGVSKLAVDSAGNVTQTGGTATTDTINGQRISAAANFTGTVTAATGLTVSAGGFGVTGNSTLAGSLAVTYAGTSGTGSTTAVTNSGASGTNSVKGAAINLTGTSTSGTNNTTGLDFGSVTNPGGTNNFYGINFGTGMTDLMRYNNTQLISGLGILQNAAVGSGVNYTNLTQVGALTSGSIASFGTISTGNTITTTAAIQGGTGTFTGASGLTLGTSSSNTGAIVLKGSGGTGTLTLQGPTTPNAGNYTLSIPAITANANVCTDNAVCTGYLASSAAIIQVPGTTAQNTIAPIAANVVALTVKGTIGTAAHVLDIYNSAGSPTLQDYFDSSGSLNVSQAIQPTSNNAIDLGLSGTAFRSGYFGTSLQAPLVSTANVASGTSVDIAVRSGNGTAGGASSGNVTVDSGSKNGAGFSGNVYIGNTNALNVNVGRNGGTGNNSALTLMGTASSSTLILSNSANTFQTTIGFTTPTATRTVTFADASGNVCLDTGNCSNAGGYIVNGTSLQTASFNVNGTGGVGGNLTVGGTYNTNTLTSSALTFGAAAGATIQSAASQALTLSSHGTAVWGTDAGNLTIQASAASANLTLNSGAGGTIAIGNTDTAHTLNIGAGGATTNQIVALGSSNSGSTTTIEGSTLSIGTANVAHSIGIGTASGSAQALILGSTNASTTVSVQAGGMLEQLTSAGLVVKSGSNLSTALQIQNAAGANVANVDTTDTNLIINPGADVALGSEWSAYGSSTVVSRNPSIAWNGTASLSTVVAPSTGTVGAKNALGATLSASTTYTLSFYAKLKSGDPSLTDISARYLRDGSTVDATCTGFNTQTVVSAGWTRIICTLATSSTLGNSSAAIAIYQGASAARTFYLDGVQLEQTNNVANAYGTGAIALDAVVTRPLAMQNTEDSTNAFTVQDAAGTTQFGIDTLNGKVSTSGLVLQNSFITPNSAMQIGSSGQNLLMQGNNTTKITATNGASGTVSVDFATIAGSGTYRFASPTANSTYTICTSDLNSCGNSSTGYLRKGIANETSNANMVSASDLLYSFSNSGSAQSGILKLDNGAGTGSTLQVIAAANAVAGSALIYANNSLNNSSGNLLDLWSTQSAASASRFSVAGSGAVTAGTINGQTITSAASFSGTVATGGLLTANSLSVTNGATFNSGATVNAVALTANAGASVSGGINNNAGGITGAGAVSGLSSLQFNTAGSIDANSAVLLSIGTVNASGITIGKSTATQPTISLQGSVSSSFVATGASGATTLAFATLNATAKTVTIPNETGTICTNAASSNATCNNFAPASASGNYVQLTPAAAQSYNSANPGIFLNKQTATVTDKIMELQYNAADVFAVQGNGNVTATGLYNTNTFNGSTLTFGTAGAATISSAASQALNVTGHANSVISTDAGSLTVTSAAAATWSTSVGALAVDSAAALNLGITNATGVNIGKTTTTTDISGTLQVGTLNTPGTGTLINNGGTVNKELALGNIASGPIGAAAATVDVYTYISIAETSTSQALTVPTPTTSTAYGKLLYISNIGTASFTMLGTTIGIGSTATLVWTNKSGGIWTFAGADGSGILNQNTADQTADFRISGSGQANTSYKSILYDTITATTLNLGNGSASATGVSIGKAATTTTNNGTLQVGASTGTGALVNNGSTVNTAYAMANLVSGGWDVGGAAATVDKYTAVSASQTTASQTLTVPAPTANTAYGRLLYLSNIGTVSFTLLGATVSPGSTATLVWANANGGAAWTLAGADGSGILNQNTFDQTANFRITGNGMLGGALTLGSSATATATLSLAQGANRSINVISATTANAVGANLAVTAGAANGSTTGAAGGDLQLTGGAAAGTAANAGGGVLISGGAATGAGSGGLVTIQGGSAAVGAGSVGGGVLIQSANGSSTLAGGAGGAINITAGNGLGTGNNAGGNITLTSGVDSNAGVPGVIIAKSGANATNGFQVQNSTGTSILTVDTANGRVGIGTGATAPAVALEVNSGTSGVSGLRFTQLNSLSTAGSTFSNILGLDTSGNVGLSSVAVSLTSPALAYWDALNDPTTGSQSYPLATVQSLGTTTFNPVFSTANGEQLTNTTGNETGVINWNFAQVPFEEIQYKMKAGLGTGADGTWFYSYADGTPTTEYGAGGTFTQGYIIYFSEFHSCVGIAWGPYTDNNQCTGTGAAGFPLAAAPLTNIGDNNFHDVDIQIRQNTIIVRWDGQIVLTKNDVYTRDTSKLNFGFGARTGGNTNNHYIKGLLVTKLGSNASQYNIDAVSPLASDLYWDNTNGRLGVGATTPTATLDVTGSYQVGTVCQGTTSACTASGTSVFGTGTTFTAAMVGSTINFVNGTSDTITGFTSATQITVAASNTHPAGIYSINRNGLKVANTGGVTVGGSFGGTTITDAQTLTGTSTVTKAVSALGYNLSNNLSANTTTATTFNITGLPNTEGTTAYISSAAIRTGTNAAQCTVNIQINGTTISSVVTTGAVTQTVKENYIVMYIGGAWRIMGYGPVTSGGAAAGTFDTADFAEWIRYNGDTAPQPGDVLTVSPTGKAVVASSAPYDKHIIGVVSTSPYQTAGADDGHSVVLALTGRVPVKVSLANGPIEAGDPLTSSSTPGVAMKATGPGNIIGNALESYDGLQGDGQILVQLHPGFNDPTAGSGQLQGDQHISGNLNASGDTRLQGSLGVAGDMNVSGKSTMASLLVNGSLDVKGNMTVTGTASVGSLAAQTAVVSESLSVGGQVAAGSSNVSGLSATQLLTVGGLASFNGDTKLTAKVNTRQATLKTFTASKAITAGSVVILDPTSGKEGQATTTTTADDTRVIGVAVTDAAHPGDQIDVAIGGWVQVRVDTTAQNGNAPASLIAGQLLTTGLGEGAAHSPGTPPAGSILGKTTDKEDTGHLVWALITLQ